CRDFAGGSFGGKSWTLDDCVNVWEAFRKTIPTKLHIRPRDVDTWRTTADELRRAGSQCLLTSTSSSDGVGSSTIRHISTWILAEEMGCDWVTPEWGSDALKLNDKNGFKGEVVYCHSRANPLDRLKFTLEERIQERQCTVVDWLGYFNFGVSSSDLPDEGTITSVTDDSLEEAKLLNGAKAEIESKGVANLPWDHVVITIPSTLASAHLAATGSWDQNKNEVVRGVLQKARQNFHQHPRPWYDEDLQCAFDPTRFNFAVHIRLGDRTAPAESLMKYFGYLEELMGTVTDMMATKGMEAPLFHVFSETEEPCPSLDTGTFEEFPTWPVELDQIPPCLTAETPKDCLLKRVQRGCFPIRSGVFRLQQKPIVLHLSPDVKNALSCMTHSDGIVMGCSTFGQIAGILTNGISFFSMGCVGDRTPIQYKTIPPLAIAERGHLWVPVAGAWYDPVLNSTDILGRALDTLMLDRDGSAP
ncbi:unnamed protein product, partial [Ascophyllum nodosum]